MKFKLAQGLLVFMMLSAVPQAPAAKDIGAKSVLDQKAPDLVVQKWLTPEPDRNGKFVLVDFWATWCAPCRKTIPRLNELQRQFPDKLVVIGISDESERIVRAFKDPKIEYALAIDERKRMFKALRVEELPHVIVIDPQGIVRWEGFALADGDELTAKVMAGIIAKYSE
jgi:thiol-disulfide isomerase/thioredoxin